MNLTFGFIAFFVTIIIPGILFRRYYYSGEFSKQFATKDPVLHSIFLSIVPGVCIQVISFYLLSRFPYFNIDNSKIFLVFSDFVQLKETGAGKDTFHFLDQGLEKFLIYSLLTFGFSAVAGELSFLLIRTRKWDLKYKLFRFKNQWYYVFSGEVLKFKKFEEAKILNFSTPVKSGRMLPDNQKVLLTFADILVENKEGIRELYTGFVVDYDLNYENISRLDKVYLLDAFRYKKPRDSHYSNTGIFQNSSTTHEEITISKVENQTYAARTRVSIPGDLFIVSGDNIVNINLTYIPSEEKEAQIIERKQKKNEKYIVFLLILTILFIALHVFSSLLDFSSIPMVAEYFQKTNFWGELFIIIYFNQFIGLFYPIKDDNGNYIFTWSSFFTKLFIFIVFTAILFLLIAKEIVCLPNPFLYF